MIEKYWDEMFGKYKNKNGQFVIPDFPEPLMSAHFGVKNMVGDYTHKSGEEVLLKYKLCVFDPVAENNEMDFHFESLSKAITNDEFWQFQKDHYLESFEFIKKLLPFLALLPNEHYHFYTNDKNGKLIASQIVGVTPSGCLLFNGVTHKDCRGQGLITGLLVQARSYFFNKKSFYWTKFPWLTYDSQVFDYQILKRTVD